MKAENFGTKWLDLQFPFACDVHFSYMHAIRNDRFKVLLLLTEPEPIRMPEEDLAIHWAKFDLIVSHEERHKKYPNVVVMDYWDTYIKDYPLKKEFDVSTLVSIGGGPRNMDGYLLREELYHRRSEINIPHRFFASSRLANWESLGLPKLPNNAKDALFTSMFHIAIENVIQPDLFTEKIGDCFKTFTIPIYRGCPHTADYGIDDRGIIRFNTINECIDICNRLTPDDYYSRMEYMTANCRLMESKENWLSRVKSLILNTWSDKQQNLWPPQGA